MDASPRRYRAGESLEDYCRVCKSDRLHTVVAADGDGRPIRVSCGFCHSEHNFRGGPRTLRQAQGIPTSPPPRQGQGRLAPPTFPYVSERERTMPRMSAEASAADLELLIRRVIREEAGISPVAPAEKWRGGTMTLRPGTAGLQEKSWPIETFFHKIVMLRNRLRTLEQVVNAAPISDEEKVKMQGYITGCYGSLTSFNVLFADEDDHFKGAGGGD
jgi:hypothetical protein